VSNYGVEDAVVGRRGGGGGGGGRAAPVRARQPRRSGRGARAPTSKGDDKGAKPRIRPSGHRLVAPKRASEVDTPG
jgi:hypothetical protein